MQVGYFQLNNSGKPDCNFTLGFGAQEFEMDGLAVIAQFRWNLGNLQTEDG